MITTYDAMLRRPGSVAKAADGRRFPVLGIMAADGENELALLKLQRDAFPILPLAVNSKTELTDPVAVVESPLGSTGVLSSGIVMTIHTDRVGNKWLEISAASSGKSNGAPVFNTMGEVIGVVTMKIHNNEPPRFVIPSRAVSNLMRLVGPATIPRWYDYPSYGGILTPLWTGWREGLLETRNWEMDECAQKLVQRLPNDAATYFALGYAHYNARRYNDSVTAFRQAVTIEPKYAAAWDGLGFAYRKLGRHAEARDACQQAVKAAPDYQSDNFDLRLDWDCHGRKVVDAANTAIGGYFVIGSRWHDEPDNHILVYEKAVRITSDTRTRAFDFRMQDGVRVAGRIVDDGNRSNPLIRLRPEHAQLLAEGQAQLRHEYDSQIYLLIGKPDEFLPPPNLEHFRFRGITAVPMKSRVIYNAYWSGDAGNVIACMDTVTKDEVWRREFRRHEELGDHWALGWDRLVWMNPSRVAVISQGRMGSKYGVLDLADKHVIQGENTSFFVHIIGGRIVKVGFNTVAPAQLVTLARRTIGVTVGYDSSYQAIPYPNGDVPIQTGVCSDVIVRAFRGQGIDLQQELQEDMRRNFAKYPQNWGLKRPDPNIDHRRVPNLMTFFQRRGWQQSRSSKAGDYHAGDIAAWNLGGGVTHIGFISDRLTAGGVPLVIHNIGRGVQEEDILFAYTMIGHYRIRAEH
ncbi:MAG: DUF1287 domain-containing protein [Verrucomicrobia bacterium]|nr:DUF1287 domain-containing protein [Verrucomicrobiota bacterium]